MNQPNPDPNTNQGSVAQRLKEIRSRSGLSVRKLADALGIPASSYQHYEGKKYTKRYLDTGLCSDLAEIFKTKGIDPAEVMALAGFQGGGWEQNNRGFSDSGGSERSPGFEVSGTSNALESEATVGVDVDKLQAVAQAVEELTDEMELPIDPARKGKMIARLYNLLYEQK
ncbi:MAG: helix-turn-helix transcriptional regulator [Rhodospirillaceae bacterium]|mgnify:FL=1|jgi:transcriptional regulator with XRE-family HTH domain|nr:helix-turn-helix transcriptional regulator [Rhodospirillales bacterium]MBT3906277.1 helix-turn-helix transcriptional regulator [Rhodospirillaceae bacterium]MBT4702293.1 helix-turn-helix transcriptional regulator [Rhodospirillaceae bacterium]MBT5033405.1 helix-turn-helix transcriptional regulator [Rhodospirillaceae bacterium]MBT6218262.1 helix-turn-helix transcriptional regulator [Rhodospirillaceae bacterium]